MDWEKLWLIIIDKALIGVLLLIVGFWINRKLQQYKLGLEEGLDTRVRIAEKRLPAYRLLWAITQPTTRARDIELSMEERNALYDQLREWYYDSGNGIFLSSATRDLYLDAREKLRSEEISDDQITAVFSNLRSEIKSEIGIYGEFDE